MKYDVPYEVVDSRQVDPIKRIGPVAKIVTNPGVVEVVGLSGPGLVVDDSIGFDDDPAAGLVVLMTPEGRVALTVLTLQVYRSSVLPFVREYVPDFQDEREMQQYFMTVLGE